MGATLAHYASEGTTVDFAHLALIITHGIGLLLVVIGIGIQIPAMRKGAAVVTLLAVVGSGLLVASGLGLAGLIAATGTPNWPKLAIKLVIAVSLFVGLLVHRGRKASTPMVLGMLALTVVNAVIAVAW